MVKKLIYGDLEITVLEKTAVRRIDEALRKLRERYRYRAGNSSDLIEITTVDLNPIYTYISPSHKKVMGYEPEDLIGKAGFRFIHPGDKKKLLPLLKKYISKKNQNLSAGKDLDISETIEYRARDKSGNWHILQSKMTMIENEFIFISKDITEQKQTEKKRKN